MEQLSERLAELNIRANYIGETRIKFTSIAIKALNTGTEDSINYSLTLGYYNSRTNRIEEAVAEVNEANYKQRVSLGLIHSSITLERHLEHIAFDLAIYKVKTKYKEVRDCCKPVLMTKDERDLLIDRETKRNGY